MATPDSLPSRRSFLAALSAAGGWFAAPTWTKARSALRVEASSTPFYSHPDGANNLVRFTITGTDAPAGRLRVYDRSRRLLGTAGVLRRGDALWGELWLPLEARGLVVSELEAPGIRGPFRTEHNPTPQRKWTIHLFSMVDARSVTEELSGIPHIQRAVQTALYRSYGVQANPIPRQLDWNTSAHVAFLRSPAEGVIRAELQGIPVGGTGAVSRGQSLSANEILALAGSGVRVVTVPDEPATFRWLVGPGESRILAVSMPGGANPRALGFHDGSAIMANHVEAWLTTSRGFLSPDAERNIAVVTGDETGQGAELVHRAVSDWNARFAFPTIIPGDEEALLDAVTRRGGPITVFTPPPNTVGSVPSLESLQRTVAARHTEDDRRTRRLVGTLAALVVPGSESLEGIAAEVRALVPGTIVFNPSPFARSEFVTLQDGTEQLVTNVPGLGYAYFPDSARGEKSEWIESEPANEIEGRALRIRVGQRSGAIESLTDVATGKEWVRQGWAGLNSIEGTRVQRTSLQRLPGAATRLTVDRWSAEHGEVRSTITVYDRLPWLDIANRAEVPRVTPVAFSYPFNVAEPRVSWEVPAGREITSAPVEGIDPLGWIRIGGQRNAILLGGRDTAAVSVGRDGRAICFGSQGLSRFRLGLHSEFDSPDLPWQFGWGTTPMVTTRCVPRDEGRLPTFGAILDVDRVGVAVLGVVPARDGHGVILYVQELLGMTREVRVGAGLVRFNWAQEVDFLERPVGSPLSLAQDRVSFTVRASGAAALRLAGLELNLT